jgi:hypothetical protein
MLQGAFTPLGLTLLQNLAERGAHIVAASPEPISSPRIDLLIEVLRSTTKNEHIYADYCDLESPHSVRDFCTRFLTGNDTRLDAIVFAHEYHNIGHVLTRPSEADDARRHALAMSTFLMITLLLPVFLVAPAERDIRIINVCNPFYAAAVPDFTPTEAQPPRGSSLFYKEGLRSLRTALLTRHLQRVLDALPNRTQAPETEGTQETVPVVSASAQKSNIVAVSVSPGISRLDTITPLLGSNISTLRFILYVYFYMAHMMLPLLNICTHIDISFFILSSFFFPKAPMLQCKRCFTHSSFRLPSKLGRHKKADGDQQTQIHNFSVKRF